MHDRVRQDIAAGRLRLVFEEPQERDYLIVRRQGVLRIPAKAFVDWLLHETQFRKACEKIGSGFRI